MTAIEPELITIIEGPTPEFRVTPHEWAQSIQEGPDNNIIATCQLRTGNGPDILDRCRRAWVELRPVKLDFPDEMRIRRQINVMALRLGEVEEGPLLHLWVSLPMDYVKLDDDDDFDFDDEDDEDDDLFIS